MDQNPLDKVQGNIEKKIERIEAVISHNKDTGHYLSQLREVAEGQLKYVQAWRNSGRTEIFREPSGATLIAEIGNTVDSQNSVLFRLDKTFGDIRSEVATLANSATMDLPTFRLAHSEIGKITPDIFVIDSPEDPFHKMEIDKSNLQDLCDELNRLNLSKLIPYIRHADEALRSKEHDWLKAVCHYTREVANPFLRQFASDEDVKNSKFFEDSDLNVEGKVKWKSRIKHLFAKVYFPAEFSREDVLDVSSKALSRMQSESHALEYSHDQVQDDFRIVRDLLLRIAKEMPLKE